MFEKIILLVILNIALFLYDGAELIKNKQIRIIYGITMVAVFYHSVMYVFDLPWPTLYTFVDFIFHEPGQRIIKSLEIDFILFLITFRGMK
jgi:ABC-type protease/lipase transport system fused ATPase/permease subunit